MVPVMAQQDSPGDGIAATGRPTEIRIDAVVIRADGTREDLGTVAYWHRNPLKRLRHAAVNMVAATARKRT